MRICSPNSHYLGGPKTKNKKPRDSGLTILPGTWQKKKKSSLEEATFNTGFKEFPHIKSKMYEFILKKIQKHTRK